MGLPPFLYIHDGTDVLEQEEEVMAMGMGMIPFVYRHDGYRRVALGRRRGGGGDAEETISIQT